jgi:hypothetical protein
MIVGGGLSGFVLHFVVDWVIKSGKVVSDWLFEPEF